MPEIIVHQIVPEWGLRSVGPFCLKLEAWLKLADIPYRTVVDATPFSGPKGKLPWAEIDGVKIGDSGFIIEHLKARLGRDPDARLDASQRATAHALRRLIEDSLYWVLVYDRWMVDANWLITRSTVLGGIPAPLRMIIAPVARRGVRRQLAGQGTGKHTREEIHAIGCRDVDAVADLLADKPYLMGAEATEIDAVAYGVLANIVNVPYVSPVKDHALLRANLVGYLDRVAVRCFG